ncbi:PAS domain S-box protein [Draconibacterium mangrovi]|uniref:PAS domain S-box protein n=1 Tax=Draconibacterium mangrovi TaxID=2697469 RepID=UPI0013D82736|nr:PAS domain S-box protein [Draconibacterium mangrovi]
MTNQADQKIAHLQTIITAIRKIQHLIISGKDSETILEKTCEILVDTRGYYFAWITLFDEKRNTKFFTGAGAISVINNIRNQATSKGFPDHLWQTLSNTPETVHSGLPGELLIDLDTTGWTPFLAQIKDEKQTLGVLCVAIPAEDSKQPVEEIGLDDLAQGLAFALTKFKQHNELKANELRYKNLVDSLNDGVLIIQDEITKFVNQSLCRLTGYTEKEILENPFITMVAPTERELVIKLYTDFITGKSSQTHYDSAAVTKSGETFSVEVTISHTVYDNKPAIMVILHDNSELKKSLEQIKESEEYFRFLSDSAFEGIIIHDNGVILDVNDTLLNITGYSREEIIGKNLLAQFIDLKDHDKIYSRINSEVVKPYVLKAFKKDGTYRHVEIEAREIQYKGKKVRIAAVRDISERYQLQEEIKEGHEKLNRILDNLPGVAYNCQNNADWTLNFVSRGSSQLFGYSPEELTAEQTVTYESLIHPDDKERIRNTIQEAIDKDESFEVEYRIYTKQNQLKWVWERGKAINEHNNFHLEGFISDITTRKKLEIANELFSKAIEASPVSILITDKHGRIEYVNPFFENLTGYKNAEIVGKNPRLLNSEYHSEEFFKHLWQTINSGKIWHGEIRNKKNNGELYWVQAVISPIFNNQGEITQFIAVREDITEKKQTLKELQRAKEKAEQNEARFKALHNASFGGIAIHDKGQILDCNHGLSIITCYSHEELIGMDGLLLIAEDQRDLVKKHIQEQYTKPYESVGLRKNGQTYPLRIQGKMIPYNNKIVRVVEFRDITEQKEIEKELVRAKENAEQSDKLKSSFLANMSHEIRTPMNGILGFTELLRDNELSLQQRTEFIDVIQNSGERMLTTINDIIDISKIESGMVIAHMQDINLPALIKELYIFFEQPMKQKGITFKVNENNGNPVMLLHTDPDKLNSILTNLIRNAYKFTASGTVEFGYTTTNSHINFFVKDTGVGIPQKRQEAIFERFVQADIADSRVFEGSGLGLSITKSYTEMLNGTINLESEVGKGTTVYVSLPLQATINSQQTTTSDLQVIVKDLLENKLKILIAEDDTISIELLKLLVRDLASEILVANNGKKAVEMARNTPDLNLILMDIKMPVIDGYTATKMIREFNTSVKIIAQSAFAQTEDIEKARAAGCDDFVSKPINRKLLIETINALFLNDF